MNREMEFHLAKVYINKTRDYKIRPVLIVEDKGNSVICLPVTSQLNCYPGSKTGRARIDIGPWYVNRHSQIICNKPIIVLSSHLFERISICKPEDYSVILEKYKKFRR